MYSAAAGSMFGPFVAMEAGQVFKAQAVQVRRRYGWYSASSDDHADGSAAAIGSATDSLNVDQCAVASNDRNAEPPSGASSRHHQSKSLDTAVARTCWRMASAWWS